MTEKDYLDLFKISEGKYIIGIFQDTITVYKQQRRALNIFQALINEKVIPLEGEFSIAVIGGGAAGVTFAAAALKSNITVTLLERQAEFLHMQQGCSTRKIHPNLYDWPDVGSTFPSARLPVLSWTHDTASNVARQIVGGLDDIEKQIKASTHPRGLFLFNPHKNDTIVSITPPSEKTHGKFHIVHKAPKNGKLTKFNTMVNLIIYAVGYGVETGLTESGTPSYWRNDALSQSILHDNRRFLVSGVGDGALIDLCRLKIRNYNYDKIMDLLKSDAKKYQTLITELQRIKNEGKDHAARPADYYMSAFSELTEKHYGYFWDQVVPDIIEENQVILNTRRPDDDILDFEKVSMLNAFVVFLLKKDDHFTTLRGEMTFPEAGGILIDGKAWPAGYQPVIRHGTNKEKVMEQMHLTAEELDKLKSLDTLQKKAGYGKAYWSFNSISQCFKKGAANKVYAVMPYEKRSEYVTADTRSFCLGSMISLARTLRRRGKGRFRVALHRITHFDDSDFFQQITPYQGSVMAIEDQGCFGNIHELSRGIVGAAAKSGIPLLMQKKEDAAWQHLHEQLGLDKDHHQPVTSQLYLAIPVLAPVTSGGLATNLIIYAEADDTTFLHDQGNIEVILSAIDGLTGYLEQMLEEGKISMSELEFDPLVMTGTLTPGLEENCCLERLDRTMDRLFPSRYPFRLKKFYSFDIIYNR